MSWLIKQVIQNPYTRFLVIIFSVLTALGVFHIISTYHITLSGFKNTEKEKIAAIAQTLAQEINGNKLHYLLQNYPEKDAIKHNEEHPFYNHYHELLETVRQKSKINTPIYTLNLNRKSKIFHYGYSSAETPHYQHEYKSYPQELLWIYDKGGFIEPYQTSHGYYISYVVPIYDSQGKVVSVLEVDSDFDKFLSMARKEALKDVWISVAIFLVILFALFRIIKTFLRKENETKQRIKRSHEKIKEQNLKITDSINYAKRIQSAILPKENVFKTLFPHSFIIYEPRDIVSGDFYWVAEDEDKIIVAAADCTGHGVPGALMSMIGNSTLNNVVIHKKITKPSDILNELRKEIISLLNSNPDDANNKDGMDIALVSVSKTSNKIEYAGAFNPLYLIRNKELQQVKANRQPIGLYWKKDKEPFINHEIAYENNDIIYIFSDGYADQFGGHEGKKFGSANFRKLLLEVHELPFDEQATRLRKALNDWKGNHEQLDDILIIGFKAGHSLQ